MKTAEEVYRQITGCIINHGDIKTAMIEFAKLHVQAALEAASEKAETDYTYEGESGEFEDIPVYKYFVHKDSIINSYPESNIK
jgi:hypothetical protein